MVRCRFCGTAHEPAQLNFQGHCLACEIYCFNLSGDGDDDGWDALISAADDDYDSGEPVGSCDNCETNVYAFEDDGSGLCGHCQWLAEQSNAS